MKDRPGECRRVMDTAAFKIYNIMPLQLLSEWDYFVRLSPTFDLSVGVPKRSFYF